MYIFKYFTNPPGTNQFITLYGYGGFILLDNTSKKRAYIKKPVFNNYTCHPIQVKQYNICDLDYL